MNRSWVLTTAVAIVVGLAAPAAAAPVVMTGPELTAGLLAPDDVPGEGWVSAPSAVIEPEAPHAGDYRNRRMVWRREQCRSDTGSSDDAAEDCVA